MRYKGTKIFHNEDEYYEYLRRNRKLKAVDHYATPVIRNPTISDRMSMITTQHIWSYGNRLSNLAFKYYGDVRFWWIIAWYNGVGTEADLKIGDMIDIPIDLNTALSVYGA